MVIKDRLRLSLNDWLLTLLTNLHMLAAAWLILATTLSVVVIQAVFGPAMSPITGSSARCWSIC